MIIYKVYYTCPHKSKLKLNESILLSLAILTSEGDDLLYSKWMTTFYLKETEYLTKNIQKLPQTSSDRRKLRGISAIRVFTFNLLHIPTARV